MDLTCLYLGNTGWVPCYIIKELHQETLTRVYEVYMPFRTRENDRYTKVNSQAIFNLFVNEARNMTRAPQMIPRVMVKL